MGGGRVNLLAKQLELLKSTVPLSSENVAGKLTPVAAHGEDRVGGEDAEVVEVGRGLTVVTTAKLEVTVSVEGVDLLDSEAVVLLEPLEVLGLVLLEGRGDVGVLNDVEDLVNLAAELVVEGNGALPLLLELGGSVGVRVGLLVELEGIVDHGGVLCELILGLDDVRLGEELGGAEVGKEREAEMPVEEGEELGGEVVLVGHAGRDLEGGGKGGERSGRERRRRKRRRAPFRCRCSIRGLRRRVDTKMENVDFEQSRAASLDWPACLPACLPVCLSASPTD